jgi:signal transduction histidine kinase
MFIRHAQRSMTLIAIAALVPLTLLGTLLVAGSFFNTRVQLEQATLARAGGVAGRIDSELMIDRGALLVLGGSEFLIDRDWPAARSRAIEVQKLRPRWQNVVFTDTASMTPIWATPGTPSMSDALSVSIAAFIASGQTAAIGGTETASEMCRCIVMHQIVQLGPDQFVLSLQRDVGDFQTFLTDNVQPPEVGAVVDANGLFIARTVDHDARFGTPATQYVRDAVQRGGSAVYGGVTYEGLRNQTAYMTSASTSWSAHLAVPAARFELLGAGSIGTAIFAVFAAILFAVFIAVYAFRDEAARRLAERAQFQSQKLESLGHLSGTVAHDFNNLLAVILACFQIVERQPLTDRQTATIAEAKTAVDRGSALIQQLLGFARHKPMEVICVDIAAKVKACQPLLVKALGPGITLECNIAANVAHAKTNGDQIELALLNLVVNAGDAMPGGGRVVVSLHASPVRGFIDLDVQDNGPGMSKEIAARVFDPYFTTKEEGKGTGLGLAQVQTLAIRSGGELLLDTSPGKGAKFTIRLLTCAPAGARSDGQV